MRSPIGPARSGPRTVTGTGLGVRRGSWAMIGMLIELGSARSRMTGAGMSRNDKVEAIRGSGSVNTATYEQDLPPNVWMIERHHGCRRTHLYVAQMTQGSARPAVHQQ